MNVYGNIRNIEEKIILKYNNWSLMYRNPKNRAKNNIEKAGMANRVNFVDEDIKKFINENSESKYDLIFWSEGIYYLAPPCIPEREFSSMLEKLNNMLKDRGLFCSANIIDQESGDEKLLTDRKSMELIFEFLRDRFISLEKDSYEEYKEESHSSHSYEIWLFRKKD